MSGFWASLAVLVLFSSVGCTSVLYHPTRNLYVDPNRLNPSPEEHEFSLANGLKIHGWYLKSSQSPSIGVVLHFHGNAQNRTAHFFLLHWLTRHGYDLAIFDYPGYGSTLGKPTPKNTVEMARGALRYLKERKPELPLIVYGQSLGGAVAMRAVWEEREAVKPDLLVIDSAFLSYQKVARGILGRSAWAWILKPFTYLLLDDEWAPGDRIKDLDVPLVVIHSRQDEVVPFEFGEEIFKTARGRKEFWIKESGSHNATYWGPEGEALKERLVNALPKRLIQN